MMYVLKMKIGDALPTVDVVNTVDECVEMAACCLEGMSPEQVAAVKEKLRVSRRYVDDKAGISISISQPGRKA